MKLTITIETGNAAFDGFAGYEVARILRELCTEIEECATSKDIAQEASALRDVNGNKVGLVKFTK